MKLVSKVKSNVPRLPEVLNQYSESSESGEVNVLEVLAGVSGASFMGVDVITEPTLKGGKSNPHRGRVKKHVSDSQAIVFQNKFVNGYENMVKRRLVEEGKDAEDFKLSERPWGKRVPGLPIVEHTNKEGVTKHYLELIYMHPGKVEYYLDNAPVKKEIIEGLEDKSEGEQGGLNNKVFIRTIALENVKAIRANGKEYVGNFVFPGVDSE